MSDLLTIYCSVHYLYSVAWLVLKLENIIATLNMLKYKKSHIDAIHYLQSTNKIENECLMNVNKSVTKSVLFIQENFLIFL